jgi:hypothetical protein
VQRILNKSLRGVLPLKPYVQDIANRLLRERSRKPIARTRLITLLSVYLSCERDRAVCTIASKLPARI